MDLTATAVGRAQRLEALEHANRVRRARSELKRRIASGELVAAEVILNPRREIDGMAIDEVLASQRQWGAQRSREFLRALAMPEGKTVGSMTERQRIATAALLSRSRERVASLSR